MVSQPLPNPEQSDTDQLEAAADQAIATCGGDAREVVKALIVSRDRTGELRAAVSMGYARGKLMPPDRKDWYD